MTRESGTFARWPLHHPSGGPEAAPHGVGVEEVDEGVLLSGRGLARRSITDPALRWIGARPA